MTNALLHMYHRLPVSLRSIPASMRGMYLSHWRYGSETERLVQEALEREQWSETQWKAWADERLAFILHRAVTRVPYYRDFWARHKGQSGAWNYVENWPVLEKHTLRENPRAFVADDCSPWRMFHDHTSGTTGTPVHLWFARRSVREFCALFEARWRRWYGVSRHDRWAILGGQLVVPAQQKRAPFWVWNAPMHQLYLSAYHLSSANTPHYLDALIRYNVRYLWGYSSALYVLADACLRLERSDIKMNVVITNAEPLLDHQRSAISAAFQCPVRETYGMSEIVAAASECMQGRLHLWPEAGYVEIVRDGQQVSDGEVGEIVATGFLNPDMPLIRYRVGDLACAGARGDRCRCMRTLPLLRSVDGRLDDVVITREGRQIGRLDPVFKGQLPIREAQIIQESLDLIRVKVVPASGFNAESSAQIKRRLLDRIGGGVEIVVDPVGHIERTSSGKFRSVISLVKRSNAELSQGSVVRSMGSA